MSDAPKIIGLKPDGLGGWALATVDDVNSGTVFYTRAGDGDRLQAEGANELIARLRDRAAAARAEGNATALGDALAFEGAAREIDRLRGQDEAIRAEFDQLSFFLSEWRTEAARLAAENERLRAALRGLIDIEDRPVMAVIGAAHEFVADYYRPSRCVNCGQKRDHELHLTNGLWSDAMDRARAALQDKSDE